MSPTTAGKRRVPWYKKLAGLALGTVLSLLCLELTLRVMHAIYSPESRALAHLAPGPGERRILCMGDSNTYGVYLEAEASYPGRLQSYLDAAPDNPWRVFNLGYPGQNTAQMRARLAANLEAYQPEILVLWGGVNNTWSPAMRYLWDHPDDEPAEVKEPLLDRSRALGALRMMFIEGRRITFEGRRSRHAKGAERPGDFAVPGLAGADRGEGLGDVESAAAGDKVSYGAAEVCRGILVDLRRILAICKEHDVALVLGEYWVERDWIDDQVNSAITEFAESHGVPVVPLCDRMRELMDAYGSDVVTFGGGHAKETGNRAVARQVLLTLVSERLLEGVPEWTSVPPLEQDLDAPHPLSIEVIGRKEYVVDVRVSGRVRARYTLDVHVLVGGEIGERVERLTGLIEINRTSYRRIQLPAAAAAGTAGWRLVVAYADRSDAPPAPHIDVPIARQER